VQVAYADCLDGLKQFGQAQTKGLFDNNEWSLHLHMHLHISKIIEPSMNRNRTWRLIYNPHRASTWNYAPKCFERFEDLSQPKVDTSFLICVDQGKCQPASPLYVICEQVANQDYFHTPRQHDVAKVDTSDLSEIIELLSKATLDTLHKYVETAEVSFPARLPRKNYRSCSC
jgi:hypothetical protein